MRHNASQLTRRLALLAIVGLILCGILYVVQVLPDTLRRRENPYEESWLLDAQDRMDIHIDLSAVDIEIRRYDGADVNISFEGFHASGKSEESTLMAVREGNTLRIDENELSRGKINLGPWGFDVTQGTLTVLLPQEDYGQVTIKSFSGDVSIEGMTANTLTAETSSGHLSASDLEVRTALWLGSFAGDLALQNLEAEICTLSSSSGNVGLSGGDFDALSLSTFSGKVELSSLEVQQKATLETSSGSVRVTGLQAESLRCQTFSGDVTLAGPESESLSVETSSGKVQANLTEMPEATAIDTFSGTVTLGLPSDAEFTCTTDTFSGHVTIGFSSVLQAQGDGGNAHVVGDGEHRIRIGTSSGNITIQPE